MKHRKGADKSGDIRLGFDRRVRLEFHGSKISSDGGLVLFGELDEVLGLHDIAGGVLKDTRPGHNRLHSLVGRLRQSVFGRLAGYDGYDDVNDADRPALDPVMRQVVGGRAVDATAASASRMGRFETEVLATTDNRTALTDVSGHWIDRVHERNPPTWITLDMAGHWIDRVHERNPPTWITLDMDSSVSPTHGAQEGTAWNGHFGCMCCHPLFVFNQFGHLERCALRPGNVHSADGWDEILKSVIARYTDRDLMRFFRADAAFAIPGRYEMLEANGYFDAIRLRANRVLQGKIAHLLKRPVGRPPNHVRRFTVTSSIRRRRGTNPAVSSQRSRGIPASCFRASGSSSPTFQWSRTGSSASTTGAAPPGNTSRKESRRSTGQGCPARAWRRTRCGFSFMRWPTISVSSCKEPICQRRWPTGR